MKKVVAVLVAGSLFSQFLISCGPATPPPKATTAEPPAPPVAMVPAVTQPDSSARDLPDPAPPFQVQASKRQDPELRVSSISFRGGPSFDQPSFWVGNKRVGVREASGSNVDPQKDQIVGVMVNNRGLFRVTFWGAQKDSGTGYPFASKPGTEPELKTDPAAGTITYLKPYLLPGGETAVFSYVLKSLGDSKVELTWDIGIPQEKLETLPKDFSGVTPWIISDKTYRDNSMRVNGKPLTFTPAEKLTKASTPLGEGKGAKIEFAPEDPLQAVSFELPDTDTYSIAESSPGADRYDMIIRTNPLQRRTQGRMVFDLGVAAVRDASAPDPVAGVDFWQRDAMDVPRPPGRNLMPNGSFEQGLRYWAWWGGGGPPYTERSQPKYDLTSPGKFGRQALLIREGQAQVMQSFPIPVVKDKTYTASFYVKAAKPGGSVNFGVMSPIRGSKLDWRGALSSSFRPGTDWQRFSVKFKPDQPAVVLLMGSNQEVIIDGIQIEEGEQPTGFSSPAVEGFLTTSDPDNMVPAGQPLNPGFELSGTPGLKGEVELTLLNYYREKIDQEKFPFTLDANGFASLPLSYDAKKIGLGVFVLKANYHVADQPDYRDYYRFSIMEFLENKHATKDIFGDLCMAYRIPRGNDLARNYMRWGFGSSTYNCRVEGEAALQEKNGIQNLLTIIDDSGPEAHAFVEDVMKHWTEITPEREKQIEDFCAGIVAKEPWNFHWAFSTESEYKSVLTAKGNFAEWSKVQLAFARGVKRGNPKAEVLFDGGTSGFSRLRGYRETEGYLAATQGKIKWDAIATHPYGNLDNIGPFPNDLDAETTRLVDLAQKYGYGPETPIDYTEGFNETDFYLPEWGLGAGSDNYDNFGVGRPTYDWGWREFTHAAWVARTYIICLKYWPHVRSFNIWVSRPSIDMYLTPLALCKVTNTLGHLLPKPTFKGDVRPAAGVRGYVFEDEQGRGVAAIWCAIDKVEEGLERGPEMSVNFGTNLPECLDLMGNPRAMQTKNGEVSVQLSPAPIFFRTAKGGADQLLAALNGAAIAGAGSALKVAVQPTAQGQLELSVHNQTNRLLEGEIVAAGSKVPFQVAAQATQTSLLTDHFDTLPGKLLSWKQTLQVNFPSGKSDSVDWNTSWFYVPHTAQPLPEDPMAAAWNAIPALPLTNHVIHAQPGKTVAGGGPGDLEAQFQLAWDKDNLYLRVTAKDDRWVLSNPALWRDNALYMHDGCAEVYFDTGANGRSNPSKGYDLDDYRYDFSCNREGTDGAGAVYRLQEPDHQLAGGIDMPTKEEAATKVKAQFRRTADGYAYVMIFPQRYIEPLRLEKGFRSGFGLYLHDNDDPAQQWPEKGLSFATEPGAVCDHRPDLWPILVLGE